MVAREQVVLVLEIMVDHAGGDASLSRDAGHGGMVETVLMNDVNGRFHQLLPADRAHSKLRHCNPRARVSFFVGRLSNINLQRLRIVH